MSRYGAAFLLLSVTACEGADGGAPTLQRERRAPPRTLPASAAWPNAAEAATVGAIERRVQRKTSAFERLVQCEHPRVVFKDEERTGADRLMTLRLRQKLHALAGLVQKEWPSLELRVTEAWDENGEHGKNSLHYEGRAVDVTTSDLDQRKLGRLAGLAVQAGFDWVYRESTHVHASVSR